MKIKPDNKKLIVLPLESKEGVSEGGLIIPDSVVTANLSRAEVVEVSDDLADKYSAGDVVLHPSNSGLVQHYNGKHHLWLRYELGEVWGKEVSDVAKEDKEDWL